MVLLLLPERSVNRLHPEHHNVDRGRRQQGRRHYSPVQHPPGHARRPSIVELPVRHIRTQLRRLGRPSGHVLRRMVRPGDLDRGNQARRDDRLLRAPGRLLHRLASNILRCRDLHRREGGYLRRRGNGTDRWNKHRQLQRDPLRRRLRLRGQHIRARGILHGLLGHLRDLAPRELQGEPDSHLGEQRRSGPAALHRLRPSNGDPVGHVRVLLVRPARVHRRRATGRCPDVLRGGPPLQRTLLRIHTRIPDRARSAPAMLLPGRRKGTWDRFLHRKRRGRD